MADHPAPPFPAAPPLVGRERERALLRAALDAALAGSGHLVLIGGEAGIGKTALAEACCDEAHERGALVLVGRCYDLTETPPYGPWVDLFGRYRSPEGWPARPAAFAGRGTVGAVASQAALVAQMLDFFTALTETCPLVLLLDDLHWADPASLDLLRVLARHLAGLPLLMVVTYRREAVAGAHPLYALIPALVREARALRLDLRPLPDEAVHALVDRHYALPLADAARLSGYVQRRAEGNPFFIGELLRTLQEEAVLHHSAGGWLLDDLVDVGVPTLVRQVLSLRLQRLDEEVQRLLAIAAVLGQEIPLAIWRTVAEAEDEALLTAIERAEAAHLLAGTRDGTRVRFVHALIRETLYEGMTAARRRDWHRRAGEVLAAMPGGDADAVAYHFERAGDDRAVTWLVRAGDAAHRAYAWLTAAQRYEAALAQLDSTGEPTALQAVLHYRVARMLRFSDPVRAIEHLDVVQRIAATLGDRALVAYALGQRGRLRAFAGELEASVTDLAAGIAALDALAPADLVRLTGLEATTNWLQTGRMPLALQLARAGRIAEAVAVATTIPSTQRTIAADHGLGVENAALGLGIARALRGEPEAATASFAESRSESIAGRDFHGLGFLALMELRMVALACQTDDLSRRRQLAQEGERAWANGSGVSADLPPRFPALPLLLLEGQWDQAREVALAVADNKFVVMGVHARSMLGPLAHAQGDAALAWEHVHALFPAGPATRPGTVPFFEALTLQRLASALALDAGDTTTARAWLDMHGAWLAWSGAVLGVADGRVAWAAYYRAAGDTEQARAHAERALVCASAPRQPLALLAAHRLLGELDTDAGRLAAGSAHLADALALADACAAPYERALTLLAAAELRAATGEHEAARAALAETRALLDPLGAQPVLARARALAATLPPAAARPAGLTAREAEVLRLVAAGLTNAQAAERLSLSPHTINTHLTAIYGKLGVATRGAAIRFALEHHLA